jgi:hypothetical protein
MKDKWKDIWVEGHCNAKPLNCRILKVGLIQILGMASMHGSRWHGLKKGGIKYAHQGKNINEFCFVVKSLEKVSLIKIFQSWQNQLCHLWSSY